MKKTKKEKPTPQDKTEKMLRKLLTDPQYKGRVIRPAEIIRALRISKPTFYRNIGYLKLAQEWLVINQDAPLDAKEHYKNMLDTEMQKIAPDLKVHYQSNQDERKEFFVPKETVKEKIVHAAAVKKSKAISVKSQTTELVSTELSKKDMILHRIKNAYVLAPSGTLPSIQKIMEDFGLINDKGEATSEVTESDVRQVMVEEDWKRDRAHYLHSTLDVIQDEVKIVTMMRNLELHRMLFEEAKLVARNNRQFFSQGHVKTLDGNSVIEGFTPDHGVIAGLAEVMRRMVDGGGNINILINQFGGEGGSAGQSGSAISLIARMYMKRLADMTEEEVAEEISKFESLSQMLTQKTDSVSMEKIDEDNSVIEAEHREIKTEKE